MPDFAAALPQLRQSFPYLYNAVRDFDPVADPTGAGMYRGLLDAWRAAPADPIFIKPAASAWNELLTETEENLSDGAVIAELLKNNRIKSLVQAVPDAERAGYLIGSQAVVQMRARYGLGVVAEEEATAETDGEERKPTAPVPAAGDDDVPVDDDADVSNGIRLALEQLSLTGVVRLRRQVAIELQSPVSLQQMQQLAARLGDLDLQVAAVPGSGHVQLLFTLE